MIFNSIEFALFLPVIFALYWFVTQKSLTIQNWLIVGASYFFYGWWDWRFLSLIAFSSIVDFFIGLQLSKEKSTQIKRKALLWTSICINLGFLGFFKYFNFFAESFSEAFTFLGYTIEPTRLSIILPVGISFYTFQTLSYTIDVYRKKLAPTKDLGVFLAFVSFFPQLVAGPIERASNLLPQFKQKRNFNYSLSVDGLRQILWGLFKKVVIADGCAEYANIIFENYESLSGSSLFLGAVFFAFQIYGDFSGYSDIAIGTARLFGFRLMKNFAFPYFSRDIAEFWRKWHISLSTWFRDYLYIPLGGSKGSRTIQIRNIFIIFIVSGFWHGANWTFITWGALNAIYFLPLMLLNKNRKNLDNVASSKFLPSLQELISIGITFFLTTIAWVFFRAESLTIAIDYLSEIFSPSIISLPEIRPLNLITLLSVFIFFEWVGRHNEYGIEKLGHNWHKTLRWGLYGVFSIIIFSQLGEEQPFIYFQF